MMTGKIRFLLLTLILLVTLSPNGFCRDFPLNITRQQKGLKVILQKAVTLQENSRKVTIGFYFRVTDQFGRPLKVLRHGELMLRETKNMSLPGSADPALSEPAFIRPIVMDISRAALKKVHTILLTFDYGNPLPTCIWTAIPLHKKYIRPAIPLTVRDMHISAMLVDLHKGARTSLLGGMAETVVRAEVLEQSIPASLAGQGMIRIISPALIPLSFQCRHNNDLSRYIALSQVRQNVSIPDKANVEYYSSADIHDSMKNARFEFGGLNLAF
jgi:hypothetical protein